MSKDYSKVLYRVHQDLIPLIMQLEKILEDIVNSDVLWDDERYEKEEE